MTTIDMLSAIGIPIIIASGLLIGMALLAGYAAISVLCDNRRRMLKSQAEDLEKLKSMRQALTTELDEWKRRADYNTSRLPELLKRVNTEIRKLEK